ncbi:cupin domain-containing protein [Pseudomonas sp. S75]|uniref:cupin domain-containing protein n=1 Tax=Pseudomonas sp. S75 TaxID=2767446 RepID=UPI002D8045CC|nr:cupin domain-containing protein [Pseudomonas sp. S75]
MPAFTILKHANLKTLALTGAGQRAGADRGDPQIAVRTLAPDAVGNLGVWECQPGGWPVVDRPDTEFTYLLCGKALLTDDQTGEVVEVNGGDLIILPPGWSGRWDVLETVRKVYAIY